MFQEIEGMMQKVASGEIDAQSVGKAADQHVNSMDSNELAQHVQTAATNAQQNGNSDVAGQLMSLVEQYRSNPQGLKSEIVTLITQRSAASDALRAGVRAKDSRFGVTRHSRGWRPSCDRT